MFVGLLLFASTVAGQGESDGAKETTDADAYVRGMTRPTNLVILGCYRTFRAAEADARKFSRRLGLTYDSRDMVFDPMRGLILREDHPDEMYAGEYVLRRYGWRLSGSDANESYISIEKSSAYTGLRRGYYIIVADIDPDPAIARSLARKFASVAPGAYAKRTEIYYGCMH